MRPPLKHLLIITIAFLPALALCQQNPPPKPIRTYFSGGLIWGMNFTSLTGYDDSSYRGPNMANIGIILRLTRDKTFYEIDAIALVTGVRFNESNQTSMGIQGGFDRQVNNNILVPVLYGRYFGYEKNGGFFVKGGVFVSRLMRATYKIPDNDALIFPVARSIDNREEFKAWDMGISLGTGYDGRWSGLDIRANWGLKDINYDPDNIWRYVDTSEPIRSIVYQVTWTVRFTYSKRRYRPDPLDLPSSPEYKGPK